MEPIALDPNPVRRFYRGGPTIGSFRGIAGWDDHAPEDWVGSTTTALGHPDAGLSALPGGGTLRDAVDSDPEAFLGPEHVDRFGANPGLLVKLLHAGERLPVHWHPDRDFAGTYLESEHGKTEAWVIVEAAPGALVHLGFRREVPEETLARWAARQEVEPMLNALHALPVAAGDTFLVPAGLPHAIGEGILLVELQEPTDYSVLLEWKGFDVDGEREGHLGLGFDVALKSADRLPVEAADLERLRSTRGEARDGAEALFPGEAEPFFRAERVRAPADLPRGFAVLVVTDGRGTLRTEAGAVDVARGATVLVPFAAGDSRIEGDAEAIRCLPPAPDLPSEEDAWRR